MKRSKPKLLLSNQVHVDNLAVDGQRKYLFVNQNNPASGKSTVTRHKLFTNFTDVANPIVLIDPKEAAQLIYQGGQIHGMTVNELLGVLLIADSYSKVISAYEYDEAILKKLNHTAPYVIELVKGVPEVSELYGVAVYKNKEVVWGNHIDGKENGAVVIASNTQDPKTYKALTKDIEGVSSIVAEGSSIYY